MSVGYSGIFLPSQNGCVSAFCFFRNCTFHNFFMTMVSLLLLLPLNIIMSCHANVLILMKNPWTFHFHWLNKVMMICSMRSEPSNLPLQTSETDLGVYERLAQCRSFFSSFISIKTSSQIHELLLNTNNKIIIHLNKNLRR